MARLHVRGRISSVFNGLIERLYDRHQAASDKSLSDAMPITPQRLMFEPGRAFPPTTRFLADTGNSVAWATHYLDFATDRRSCESRLGLCSRGRKIAGGHRKAANGWLRVTMNFVLTCWRRWRWPIPGRAMLRCMPRCAAEPAARPPPPR